MQEDANELIFFPATTSENLIHFSQTYWCKISTSQGFFWWVLTSNYRCGRKKSKECLQLFRMAWVEAFDVLHFIWQISTNSATSSVKTSGAQNLLFSPCSQIAWGKPISFPWNYQGQDRDRAGNVRTRIRDFVLQHIFWKLLIQNRATGENKTKPTCFGWPGIVPSNS